MMRYPSGPFDGGAAFGSLLAETAGYVGERDGEGRAQPGRQVPVRAHAHQDPVRRQESRGPVSLARCVFIGTCVHRAA